MSRHREHVTPGQAALIEAMRLESARIYSQIQREHHGPTVVEDTPAGTLHDLEAARRRRAS